MKSSNTVDSSGKLKLCLCGFSGSGKSSVLSQLKANRHFDALYDLDLELEKLFSCSIGQWIEKHSWQEFRDQEYQTLKNLLERPESFCLALGGGALSEKSLALIKGQENCFLLYLHLPFEQCWERISKDARRPMVKKGEDFMKKLYQERQAFYRQADYCLDTTKLTLDALRGKVENVVKELGNTHNLN